MLCVLHRYLQENEILFNNSSWDRNFTKKLHNMLADQGIIVMQLGKVPDPTHPNENIDDILASLEEAGIESVHQYENVSMELMNYFFVFKYIFSFMKVSIHGGIL